MDQETRLEFQALNGQAKVQAETLCTIGGTVEEIRESIHGQAMAIRDVSGQRALCRAEMDGKLKDVDTRAVEATRTAETAHRRIDGLTRAAWGLVVAVMLQLAGVVMWLIKLAVTSGKGTP